MPSPTQADAREAYLAAAARVYRLKRFVRHLDRARKKNPQNPALAKALADAIRMKEGAAASATRLRIQNRQSIAPPETEGGNGSIKERAQ